MTRSQPLRGEDGLLDRHLLGAAPEEAAADLGVLTLVVLAHDQHVDVGGPAPGERRLDALEQPHRAQVDVLVELAPDGDQQAPERDVVGHAGKTHRAEEDRLERAKLARPSSGIIRPVFA